MTSVLIIIA